jgi:hypothetical protein
VGEADIKKGYLSLGCCDQDMSFGNNQAGDTKQTLIYNLSPVGSIIQKKLIRVLPSDQGRIDQSTMGIVERVWCETLRR